MVEVQSQNKNIKTQNTGINSNIIFFIFAICFCVIMPLISGFAMIKNEYWYVKERAILFLGVGGFSGIVLLLFVIVNRCMTSNKYSLISFIIIPIAYFAFINILFSACWQSYENTHTVAFSSEVQDVFIGNDDHMYAVTSDESGNEIWIHIKQEDPIVSVGDVITGSYVSGMIDNDSREFYQGNATIEAVTSDQEGR